MKKLVLTIFSALILFSSCNDERYEDLNINPNSPLTVGSGSLFSASTKAMVDQMTSISVNLNHFRFFAQYVAQRNFSAESNYDLITRNVALNHWGRVYRNVLFDLQDARTRVQEEVDSGLIEANIGANRTALIDILSVYTWQQMVDTFGNIPYTDALMGLDTLQPEYEDAQTIYEDLFTRLDAALSMLDVSASAFGGDDLIYGDNMTNWRKFGNSVKLRLGIRVSEFAPMATTAQSAIEEAVAAGVFDSNWDNFKLTYESTPPNTNPVWVTMVQSGRPADYFPSNTIVDYMNDLEDPRRPFYFHDNITDETDNIIYVGGIYGATNDLATTTHLNELITDPTFRGVLLDYSEVSFMLAQASELQFNVGGDAATHYTNGIIACMQDWGVEEEDITTYLNRSDVDYNTAPGTWREKLGLQYWLAMYNRGFAGWTAWRQLDAPALNVAADSQNPVPNRYTYPVEEQTLNGANYTSAAQAIGGDTQQVKVFWDN
ncbi:MAG: SusD/RagB family nutrient-binding outer membrane lipoprotein [Allomuricauda sp.]